MEDITNAVMFLTSNAARHITGQVISVNGGFAMVG
jgi:enoyl-[acyl-carrier-protein] reductase (NADH)